ncbi:phosphoglycolate phosphatase [Amphibiibacter pelophylacis]|uniref:Phosphoglycolate phosphatase n=1 Tax=Amphibiibacter pelophylacis TaxID=1799477 RepID=A0ACC6P5K6_9BURK
MSQAADLVFFDLDGTLVETAPEILDATNATLAELGQRPVGQTQIEAWIGHGTQNLLAKALAWAQGAPIEAVAADPALPAHYAVFQRHYARCCGTRSRLYPGVRSALERLRQRGARLAVLTNKERAYTLPVLDAHGLTPLFDDIVCGDSHPRRKPDPMGLLAVLSASGLERKQALMVGDSSTDIATARAAGVAVWALPYGYNHGQPIADSHPDRVIESLAELP